ncbi:MAG TPA: ankyrin repeat domain-containing protein [Longimicrobium sp.]|nr:ankyrin repeat domain-containing protein [Longimicrobium sp.]
MTTADEALADFIRAACVPRESSHASGTLDRAEAILAAHPEVAGASIHAAALFGDDAGVRRFIAEDAVNATARGGPYDWDALTHLCFSRYLRLDPARSDGFVRAAEALLDGGADANTGWNETGIYPNWESALYGAAGIAHHPELTRLLLERGADPNDNEVVYHTPESYDNRALELLLATGRLTADSLALMLVRKHDWHDYDGAKLLLAQGMDVNHPWQTGGRPLHHAIRRDNPPEMIELLLDHGADPTLPEHGRSAVALAARRGRGDLLALFERRGLSVDLRGTEGLIAACARDSGDAVRSIAAQEPDVVAGVVAEGGKLLAEFAGNGNTAGVAHLLDLGVPVDARSAEGDGYFGVAKQSTALHSAAWRASHDTVRLLIDRGAAVVARDGAGRTPLELAVRACVDSYWTARRSPASVEALLQAGASPAVIDKPSGYAEVDALLRQHGGLA